MNHTQTITTGPSESDARHVADSLNAQPKPCRVFVVKNGSDYEVRPLRPVSRADFDTLCYLASIACDNLPATALATPSPLS